MIEIYTDCVRCFKGCTFTQCPNYEPPEARYYCSICEEGIYPGDDYVENSDGEYAHLECVDTGSEMAEFLGYKVECCEELSELDN